MGRAKETLLLETPKITSVFFPHTRMTALPPAPPFSLPHPPAAPLSYAT